MFFCSDHKHYSCTVELSPVLTVEGAASLEDALAMVQEWAHMCGTYWSSWNSNWTHWSHRPRAAGRPLRTGNKRRPLREVDWYLESWILNFLGTSSDKNKTYLETNQSRLSRFTLLRRNNFKVLVFKLNFRLSYILLQHCKQVYELYQP